MDALIISSGQDTGGQAIRWKLAAERHRALGLRVRAAVTSTTYIRYPIDIRVTGNGGAVKRLWETADVIHLSRTPFPYDRYDGGLRRPAILGHHGTAFRTDPAPFLKRAEREGWPTAVSTLDLAEIAPDVTTWLPTAYNLEELARLREEFRREPDGKVRIAHAPTDRDLKNTERVEEAVWTLEDEGLPVELDVIEGVTWGECLRRKAAADVYVDQLFLGYGCNAIESWAMGLPVVAGVDPDGAAEVNQPIPVSTRERMVREFGGLPFYEASEASIIDDLRALVLSADLRAEWAARGMAHVQRFHAELPALERLMDLYSRAIAVNRKGTRSRRRPAEAVA